MKRLSARPRRALRILGVILLVVVAAHLTLWWLITPSRQEIAEIERWAAGQACVEDLDLWVREYARYGGEVSFTFRDPAVFNLEADGWRDAGIYRPAMPHLWVTGWADDRQQRFASGRYDTARNLIVNWYCGCNVITGEEWDRLPACG